MHGLLLLHQPLCNLRKPRLPDTQLVNQRFNLSLGCTVAQSLQLNRAKQDQAICLGIQRKKATTGGSAKSVQLQGSGIQGQATGFSLRRQRQHGAKALNPPCVGLPFKNHLQLRIKANRTPTGLYSAVDIELVGCANGLEKLRDIHGMLLKIEPSLE